MTRAISRVSHQDLQEYLGVQFQQGRPILDADLNEAQTILLAQLRRLGAATVGEGSTDDGFVVASTRPASPDDLTSVWDTYLESWLGPVRFFLSVPGDLLDDFESGGFTLSSPQGRLRVANDRPYQSGGFLRLSGHAGTVTVSRTLDEPRDLSGYEVATFRYRLNRPVSGNIRFFLEDVAGNRTVWPCANLDPVADTWLTAFATPLDLSFHVVTTELGEAEVGSTTFRSWRLVSYGEAGEVSWEVLGGAPAGVTIIHVGNGFTYLSFNPSQAALGRLTFTVQATDQATGAVASRELFIDVVEPPSTPTWGDISFGPAWRDLQQPEIPTGAPAELAAVHRYGFELFQDVDTPLVWDLDDLRLGSAALREQLGENDFVIRGSRDNDIRAQMTITSALIAGQSEIDPDIEDFRQARRRLQSRLSGGPGHFFVAGLPCVQDADLRYSHQADPNDPPLAPPPVGERRIDTVYLDAWTEPVTFVQDPTIREVALGGIDTSTRERVRYRVRVAQGTGVPDGDGRGLGALTTEGSYTAAANRLYRVEIDRPGDIGEATFRWSRENASVVARVIEPVPPGSTAVVVEDAAGLHPGDLVLLSKEFGAERHEIRQVVGNVLTLAAPTGAQLAELPAASRPGFTAFDLADRPMIQRWDGFGVAIAPDPGDETVSASIPLEDGIALRFGGSRMVAGDHWTFTTRHLAGDLAGDEVDGVGPATRIEQLDFARPHGVRHHYAPLAELVRDGAAHRPELIGRVRDRRRTSGLGPRAVTGGLSTAAIDSRLDVHLGGLRLPAYARHSTFLVTWSGDLVASGTTSTTSRLYMAVAFYDDDLTDPQPDPFSGRLEYQLFEVALGRRPAGEAALFSHTALSTGQSDYGMPDTRLSPTSVQVFARCGASGFSVELSQMRLNIVELPGRH